MLPSEWWVVKTGQGMSPGAPSGQGFASGCRPDCNRVNFEMWPSLGCPLHGSAKPLALLIRQYPHFWQKTALRSILRVCEEWMSEKVAEASMTIFASDPFLSLPLVSHNPPICPQVTRIQFVFFCVHIYRSLSKRPEKFNEYFEKILQKLNSNRYSNKIKYIVGDFNQDLIKHDDDSDCQNLIKNDLLKRCGTWWFHLSIRVMWQVILRVNETKKCFKQLL